MVYKLKHCNFTAKTFGNQITKFSKTKKIWECESYSSLRQASSDYVVGGSFHLETSGSSLAVNLHILTERQNVLETGSCIVFYPVQNLHFVALSESLVI